VASGQRGREARTLCVILQPEIRSGPAHETLRPTVCLFTDSQEPSGMGEHMLTLAAELRRCCRISFACPPSPSGRRFLERAAALTADAFGLELPEGRSARPRLASWLRARKVDVLHVHAGIAWEGHAAPSAARAARVPVVLRTEHLPYLLTEPRERAGYTRMRKHLDRIVCVSEEARASFVAAGVPPAAVAAIRNGIVTRAARRGREEVRAGLGLGPQARVILTVARFTEQKDHRTLLGAIPAVLAREPCAHFLWIGTGPLEQPMREAVRRQGLDRYIRLLGQRDDVPDLLSAADLFVLPSRFEGLPLALLEAMAARLPVVATRVCGTTEAIRDGTTGLIVEPGHPVALAAAVLRVLGRPDLGARLGAMGCAWVEREFGAARMARETLALYRQLLARAAHAPEPNAPDRQPVGQPQP
jgi:glycosyltransferase involved in cell wall biosynthesis